MNESMPESIAIIGAGATGFTAAKTLREKGFTGTVTLIGDEHAQPYRRPAVSKELLAGTKTIEQVLLGALADEIDFRHGDTAVSISADEVVLDSGDRVPFDALLLATGSRARQLDHLDGAPVFTLRTASDIEPLHAEIRRTGSLLVIGSGLIGCEAAAVARELGAEATILSADMPLSRIVPPAISELYLNLHAEKGVAIHTGVTVAAVEKLPDGTVRAIAEDGRSWEAGTVLVAVGSVANAELAVASGIETRAGIVVDAQMRTSSSNIYAAGDVAEVPNTILGGTYRSEHWNGAIDQGAAAARSMLGIGTDGLDVVDGLDVPWGWSNQYGVNLQFAGWTGADDDYVVRGSIADRRFTAFALRGDKLVGAVGIGRPKDIRAVRALVADQRPVDRALLADDNVDLTAVTVPLSGVRE